MSTPTVECHFEEHTWRLDAADAVDGIELTEPWFEGRTFRVALITVKLQNAKAYHVHASGPEVVGPLGTLAGPNRGYLSLEWHGIAESPSSVAVAVEALMAAAELDPRSRITIRLVTGNAPGAARGVSQEP